MLCAVTRSIGRSMRRRMLPCCVGVCACIVEPIWSDCCCCTLAPVVGDHQGVGALGAAAEGASMHQPTHLRVVMAASRASGQGTCHGSSSRSFLCGLVPLCSGILGLAIVEIGHEHFQGEVALVRFIGVVDPSGTLLYQLPHLREGARWCNAHAPGWSHDKVSTANTPSHPGCPLLYLQSR